MGGGVCAAVVKIRQATIKERKAAPSLNRRLRSASSVYPITYFRILHPIQNFVRSIGCLDDIEIVYCDHLFAQQGIADPIQQPPPIFASNEDHRKRLDLTCLNQRNRLKQLVQRPKSTWQDHESERVL